MVPALPMRHSEVISADPELKQAWELVDHLCQKFMGCEEEKQKKHELRKTAGYIQLGCKLLSTQLKAFIQTRAEEDVARASAFKSLRQVHIVSKWVSGSCIGL